MSLGSCWIQITDLVLVGVCVVFARRFLDSGRRGWAGYSAGTGVAALALLLWPGAGGAVRTAIAVPDHLGMDDGHLDRRHGRTTPPIRDPRGPGHRAPG